jgi:hypothetical protein
LLQVTEHPGPEEVVWRVHSQRHRSREVQRHARISGPEHNNRSITQLSAAILLIFFGPLPERTASVGAQAESYSEGTEISSCLRRTWVFNASTYSRKNSH